jgi:hypothetical protein
LLYAEEEERAFQAKRAKCAEAWGFEKICEMLIVVWNLGLWWEVEGNEIGTIYWGYIMKSTVPRKKSLTL